MFWIGLQDFARLQTTSQSELIPGPIPESLTQEDCGPRDATRNELLFLFLYETIPPN